MQSSSSVESYTVFRRYTSLDTLASFTHNYSSPPPSYDDSEAGGGRTYFLRPLRFRCDENVAQPSPPGARPAIATRRQGPGASLFVYTDVNRHFSKTLPVASAPRSTSSLSSSADALLQNAILLLDSSDSDDNSPIPLLDRDSDLNGTPNFSSDDESNAVPHEWIGEHRREYPRIRPFWLLSAVTPAVHRQPLVIPGESPHQEYPVIPSPAESAFSIAYESDDEELYDSGDEADDDGNGGNWHVEIRERNLIEISDVIEEQDCDIVSRAREIPHPDRLFLPGSYTETPVIDPVAAQAAAEERWQNRNGGTARCQADFTRLLARILIACITNDFLKSFLPDMSAVFWLNVLLMALIIL